MAPIAVLAPRLGLHRPEKALAYLESLGPEAARVMDQAHRLLEGGHKPIELRIRNRKRGRYLQHHEIVAANLAQDSMILEQVHHQHLTE